METTLSDCVTEASDRTALQSSGPMKQGIQVRLKETLTFTLIDTLHDKQMMLFTTFPSKAAERAPCTHSDLN